MNFDQIREIARRVVADARSAGYAEHDIESFATFRNCEVASIELGHGEISPWAHEQIRIGMAGLVSA